MHIQMYYFFLNYLSKNIIWVSRYLPSKLIAAYVEFFNWLEIILWIWKNNIEYCGKISLGNIAAKVVLGKVIIYHLFSCKLVKFVNKEFVLEFSFNNSRVKAFICPLPGLSGVLLKSCSDLPSSPTVEPKHLVAPCSPSAWSCSL